MIAAGWCRQKAYIRRAEAAGKSVVLEQDDEVEGGLVMQGFVSEEDFKLNSLLDREPVGFL